jgi:hypothetical protein
MNWQDVLLLFVALVAVTRWMYCTGYTEGYQRAKFEARQEEIRKSGKYFISPNGTLMPLEPR